MPGKNCAIVGCSARSARCRGLSFFRIRRPEHPEWEYKLVAAVDRSDSSFNPENANICSRHFKETCLVEGNGTGRTLIPGSLPTECMPHRSIEIPKPTPRKPPVERPPPQLVERVQYLNFGDLRSACTRELPVPWCLLSSTPERIVLAALDTQSQQLMVRVCITPDFTAQEFVMNIPVPHLASNVEKTGIKKLLQNLSSLRRCEGVPQAALQGFAELPSGDPSQLYYRHIVCTGQEGEIGISIQHTSTVRSTSCLLLLEPSSAICQHCVKIQLLLDRKFQRVEASKTQPISTHNPLHSTPKECLVNEFKKVRKEKKDVEKELENFKSSLETEGVQINPEMHSSLTEVMKNNTPEEPLQKLFWEEQVKAFESGPKGMRWHLMMLRLAILLHSRSASAYDTLRKSGVLKLPGESTLRDYTNVYHPQPGFHKNTLDELSKKAKSLKDNEKFTVLLHDEMTIKSDLVFDKRSGELVGFVKDGTSKPGLATHALVFYVVGVNTNIKASVGFFGTQTVTADVLYPLFWSAVRVVERCGLKVIASTSDKASPNQRLYDLHGDGTDVCYKTVNLYARDREIFFFSDVPHLVKTVRNNLHNSGSGKKTRYLWRNDKHLLWKHILDVFDREVAGKLRQTRLTYDHVYLTPSSTMSVRLAVQVLSFRVGRVMAAYGDPECQETAGFILKIDRFFDCLNTRSIQEGYLKGKPDLLPYRHVNDKRFAFLQEFHNFLVNWKQAVDTRPGLFSKTERNAMFLSHQTFKGLCMTLKAFPEATRFLLNHGVSFVLSNRFCQDPLENHFGRLRGMGRRNINPSLWRFGYNENKLMIGRSMSLMIEPKGNVSRKRAGEKDQEVVISTSPLKKISRPR